ncbi:BCCT family transporter [Nesterenkonia pannonica]|uniref:BCCT family transporter n=1 Tax=Nesterenkonia pannonica TaxID=1548602 RepID=UPI002164102C|nr:BCCT family transporter [Nesterenkonia pannonica]
MLGLSARYIPKGHNASQGPRPASTADKPSSVLLLVDHYVGVRRSHAHHSGSDGETWGTAATWIFENFGWFFILGVSIFLLFLIYIGVSRFGRLKLGADEEKPQHSDLAWFGMLFAVSIGTILMFWAVAEPAFHFDTPPRGAEMGIEGYTEEAAREAVGFTLYHFGLHTWTIFALPGLAFAYFIYKRNLPLASHPSSSQFSATAFTVPWARESTSSRSSAPSSASACPSASGPPRSTPVSRS